MASNAYSFTVLPGSNILSIHDSNGNVISSGRVGEAVFIYGGGFGATQGSSTVTFNGTPATVNTWTENQLNTAIPSGATTGSVVVTVGGVASNGYSFTVTESSSSNVYYYIDDMLGSSRTIVQDGQTSACYEADFYPFGGERDINVSCVQNYKFEGKERDGETQNDNFGARYYSNRFGRFMSPDWSASSDPDPVPYADLRNPQSLNLYSYTKNNPATLTDPNGHCDVDGEHHNWIWCAGHYLGFAHTQKEQANQARTDLLAIKNMTINGQTPQDFVNGATSQQLILADRALAEFFAGQLLNSLNPCTAGRYELRGYLSHRLTDI